MKKVRLIGKRMMSVLLATTLFAVPANVNICFAGKVSEEARQKNFEKQLKENLKELKKLDIFYYFTCTALASGLLLMSLVFKEVVNENAAEIKDTINNAVNYVLNGKKSG